MTIIENYRHLKKIFKKNKLRGVVKLIVKSHTTPHQIALGASIGVFLSIIPTFALGMFASLFIAWKARLNLLATYLGTLFVTPLTSPFVYLLNYRVGSFFLGNNLPVKLPIELADVRVIAKQIYLGGIITACVVSAIIYFLIYYVIVWYRRTKKNP